MVIRDMKTLDEYLDDQLQNDEFRKAWEDSQPEMDVIRAMVDARISQALIRRISVNWRTEQEIRR